MYIAPGVHVAAWKRLSLHDDEPSDWLNAVDILKRRITNRYIDPVDKLIKSEEHRPPIEKRFGFTIMAVDCLLVETLSAFRKGLVDTKGKSEKVFSDFLVSNKEFGFTEEQAKAVYYHFRCGILHQAEVQQNSKIWSIGELINVKSGTEIIINRTKFHEALKKYMQRYCEELLSGKDVELRKNFIKKMNFICRKN